MPFRQLDWRIHTSGVPLGVLLNYCLPCSLHIRDIIFQVMPALRFLKRNVWFASYPTWSKHKEGFKWFVRLKLQYASAVWDPHRTCLVPCAACAVQYSAACFPFAEYSYQLSMWSLKDRGYLPGLFTSWMIWWLARFDTHVFHPINHGGYIAVSLCFL